MYINHYQNVFLNRELSLVGLFLITLGWGTLQSCVPAFGGDQFKLPELEDQQKSFFTHLYIANNAGALIGNFLIPVFR